MGLTCKLDIGHTANGNPKVLNIYAPDGGVKKAETANEQIAFDCDLYANADAGEMKKFANLPEWMQEKIDDSFEVKAWASSQVKEDSQADGDFKSLDAFKSKCSVLVTASDEEDVMIIAGYIPKKIFKEEAQHENLGGYGLCYTMEQIYLRPIESLWKIYQEMRFE